MCPHCRSLPHYQGADALQPLNSHFRNAFTGLHCDTYLQLNASQTRYMFMERGNTCKIRHFLRQHTCWLDENTPQPNLNIPHDEPLLHGAHRCISLLPDAPTRASPHWSPSTNCCKQRKYMNNTGHTHGKFEKLTLCTSACKSNL